MIHLKVEALPGSRVEEVIHELVILQDTLGIVISCEFNEVTFRVYNHTNAEDLEEFYAAECLKADLARTTL